MSNWSLADVLESLHHDIQGRLATARKSMAHPGTKGDASENVWLELFKKYLPARYEAEKAHVVDSRGNFSHQIDVIIFDRQYSPFILNFEGQYIIPAESVYAVFEAKQSINAEHVKYAQTKVSSVRELHRTSLPIPHVGGTFDPKPLIPILGGILTFESDWSPPLGESLVTALESDKESFRLNIGCVAAHGNFQYYDDNYKIEKNGKPATSFLFDLISMLQVAGTVPMIDIQAYSQWLTK